MPCKNNSHQNSTMAFRTEHDSLGNYTLPEHVLWGIHTARAIDNFPITGKEIGSYPYLIKALVIIKQAAAKANFELGYLSQEKADLIEKACTIILKNLHEYLKNFKVDIMQGGAGTSTNMNVNEVIANVGLGYLGAKIGDYINLHPNDDVNMSQSTNDVYPTAVKISILLSLDNLSNALRVLINSCEKKSSEFDNILKIGRTQLQDAVPMTLGQEFCAYAVILSKELKALELLRSQLSEVNLGGTAIGTGINCDPRYGALVTAHLSQLSGVSLVQADNLIAATSDVGAFVGCSAVLKQIALKVSKISSDLRLLSSGPRAGLGEVILPSVQAGSSIMPGKINPVIPEMVNQVAYMVIGHDVTVTLCAENGQLQLNAFEPAIAHCILSSISMLENALTIFNDKCVSTLQANQQQCLDAVNNSIGIITSCLPALGYEKCAQIAKQTLAEGKSVVDVIGQHVSIAPDILENMLKIENMTQSQRY